MQSCKPGRLKLSFGFHEIFTRVDLIHSFRLEFAGKTWCVNNLIYSNKLRKMQSLELAAKQQITNKVLKLSEQKKCELSFMIVIFVFKHDCAITVSLNWLKLLRRPWSSYLYYVDSGHHISHVTLLDISLLSVKIIFSFFLQSRKTICSMFVTNCHFGGVAYALSETDLHLPFR